MEIVTQSPLSGKFNRARDQTSWKDVLFYADDSENGKSLMQEVLASEKHHLSQT